MLFKSLNSEQAFSLISYQLPFSVNDLLFMDKVSSNLSLKRTRFACMSRMTAFPKT